MYLVLQPDPSCSNAPMMRIFHSELSRDTANCPWVNVGSFKYIQTASKTLAL